MSPKRGAYPREFREAAVRMLEQGRAPRELAEELGVTTTTLRVWLQRARTGSHLPDRTREGVLALTVAAFERFDGFLSRLPRSALDESMGFSSDALDDWKVKDAVAHVAHHKARVVDRLMKGRALVEGKWSGIERALLEYWDPESWTALAEADRVLRGWDQRTRRRHGHNHLVFVRWRDRSAEEIVSWHRSVHGYVVAVLEGGPESWFLPERVRASRGALSYEAIGTLAVHPDQHLRDMQRALGEVS